MQTIWMFNEYWYYIKRLSIFFHCDMVLWLGFLMDPNLLDKIGCIRGGMAINWILIF
jgi:hypothetical protein